MAKKQSTKKKPAAKAPGNAKTALSGIWHKHWQLISFIVLILGVLGFIGVQQLLVYNQKQQFKQAEKSLDALAAEIIAATGQPESNTKEKSCSYRSAKWEQGDRSCRIYINLTYNTANQSSSSLKDKIGAVINSSDEITKTNYSNTSITSLNNVEIVLKKTSIWCFISMDVSGNMNSVLKLACADSAKAEFYPVKN